MTESENYEQAQPGSAQERRTPKGVQSLEIGFRVLSAIQASQEGLPLKDIAQRAGLTPSAAHNYLISLVRTGMAKSTGRGRYALGPSIASLGMSAIRQLDEFDVARDVAKSLRDRTGIGVTIAIWTESGPVSLFSTPGIQKHMFDMRVGPLPLLTSGSGLLFVTYAPRAAVRSIALKEMDLPDAQAATCDALLDSIGEQVKKQGYAVQKVDRLGFVGASAPVWAQDGNIRYALTLNAPTEQLDTTPDSLAVQALLESAKVLSALV